MTDITEYEPTTPAARQADAIGQATAVEQARAVAEVQGAIVVAQQCPRSTATAVAQMRDSCAQKGLAERAFFRYSRGSGQITGPSVHLARELARCWGNMQYGIAELRRDDAKGESEMIAFAWDVQTNTRATTTFIVKHGRDTRQGVKALTDMRDIYENNANNGARRLREQIFAILPKWFTEEAQDRCRATLENGGEKSLPQRIADTVRAFEGLGIAVDQLERKIGRDQGNWNAHDVATLTVVGKSIRNGETQREDEFPDDKVTADEISGGKPRTGERAQANGRAPASIPPGDSDPCPICGADGTQEHDDALHEMAGAS
ncbi:hypothetical protein [uncultured Jatrophihabitans sp.]|uniref:hypothetical protein n=1 Tax=uncultured Jatrophihabitans sp. TaxID=1610747 RepID=UPI0035CAC7C6